MINVHALMVKLPLHHDCVHTLPGKMENNTLTLCKICRQTITLWWCHLQDVKTAVN